MAEEKMRSNVPRKVTRIVLKTLLFLVLFVLVVFVLLFTPPAQRFLTARVEHYLEKKIGTRVQIGRIHFGLSGKVNLLNVYIEDQTRDTLLAGGAIKCHLNYLKLLSNEVQVKDIELQNITAKIRRVLPDTVFNFQYIVDAFAADQSKNPDTARTAPLKFKVSDISLDNVRLTYLDAVTGSDLFARIGYLTATIDSLDPYRGHLSMPSLIGRNVQARVRQMKPLKEPAPLSEKVADAKTEVAPQLILGTVDLSKFDLQFDNDISALHTTFALGQLKAKSRLIDLQHNRVHLDQLVMENSTGTVQIGKQQTANIVKKQAATEAVAQSTQGYDFRVTELRFTNNNLRYDNDAQPRLRSGIDYAHLDAKALTLHVNDLVFNPDSLAGAVVAGSVREKSGFHLQQLRGNILYAKNQAYLKDLYLKTPGTELRRNLVLEYTSPEALTRRPANTVISVELTNSHIQVKDILAFAPQLRGNPALANPNDVWNLNIVGNGTLNRLNVESLQFSGLKNTVLDAHGTLTGLLNPVQAGGNFTIRRLRTSQTDIALFTGRRLSNAQLDLPETFDISGTVNGNAGLLYTRLNVSTSAGFLSVNGSFNGLANPATTSYNASVRTSGLRLGSILRRPDEIGSVSGVFSFNGKGTDPNTMNTRFRASLGSLGYNHYTYRNILVNGSLRNGGFTARADINDPNVDLDLTASGRLSGSQSFQVSGMIDSIKTLPLHLTTQDLIFRGKVEGRVASLTPDYLDANLLITRALLVSGGDRLPLDTVSLVSGRNDTASFIRLNSDLVNAELVGHYRFADLGSIVQNSIQPYFMVTPPARTPGLAPYDFRFRADAVYNPIYQVFVPGLTAMDPLHAEGRFATGAGMQAQLTTNSISLNGNDLSGLRMDANTSDSGLHVIASVGHLKSGSSFDVYNTRINATALNNVINFDLGIGDAAGRSKYSLRGLLRQPSSGTFALSLLPGNLLLNYERWNIPENNEIVIGKTAITADNFILQKGNEQLQITSLAGANSPLQANFTNFRLATITGFIKSDSVLVDGVMNGNVTFENLLQNPAFTSNLNINDLSLRKDTIGNINLQVSTTGNDRYNTDLTLSGRGNDVSLNGYFTQAGKDLDLNLDLNVRQLQLNSLAGALASAIANPSGSINGNIAIRGTTARPSVRGDLNFNKASFATRLLGSQFTIDNEKLSVTENGFVFNNFTIRDSASNTLTIDGTVLTSNLVNYGFNLRVRARDFLVMNSTKTQNKLYYGRLNVSTDLNIGGTDMRPVVDGSLTVNDGTNLTVKVPQAEPGIQQRQGIVEFVDMDAPELDSLFLAAMDSLNRTEVRGMDVAVNIEVKKEAVLNVVIDEANGDFLNVQGEALISAGVDPSGKITMVGNYTLEQGAYQISFNFIQRRFDIQKGSTITWTGEPTTAQLAVTAVYQANTSPIDLVEDQIASSTPAIRNTYLEKLPFEVHLNLTGEILKPIVDFDILLPENRNYGVSNDIVVAVQSRLSQLRQDEGEINKQVFSLLLLNRFVSENPFRSQGPGFSAGTYARQSVSRLLTEQLNQLGANLIDGVDVNFDLQSTEDYSTGERRNQTELNIGLSKRLLNDRLKITVGSNFELEGARQANERSSNIAGNIAADYQLSKDGRYLLRFFRRNQYEGVVDGYIIENGISFILSVDYNRLSELLRRKKQRVNFNTRETNAAKAAADSTQQNR